MTRRIDTLVSAFGVLAGAVLLVGALREHRTGASAVWIAAGAVIFFSALCVLVRDVRRLRARQTT
ncbi:hypothetical protein [Streptomyces sp. H27-H5]|uniref:hypothetical protein n=1 Tax=Streptomyces sp. H27-H5 TaxID=2996460 RepID=UPI00226EA907|nr:hypothetical protein [Streptomyces sp. H27-H5]MCY0960678.1 hypothetical protein [Streptomyces sp. H27-H5]